MFRKTQKCRSPAAFVNSETFMWPLEISWSYISTENTGPYSHCNRILLFGKSDFTFLWFVKSAFVVLLKSDCAPRKPDFGILKSDSPAFLKSEFWWVKSDFHGMKSDSKTKQNLILEAACRIRCKNTATNKRQLLKVSSTPVFNS